MGAQKRDRNQMEGGDTHNAECAPATKKQRTDNKCKKSLKPKKDIRMFFQLSDVTEKQIENILSNTRKDIDRPLILFSDNDWDNYFLSRARYISEYNTNIGYKHKRQLTELDNKLDINSKLLSKYDDLESNNFLSFGIVTYYQNKQSLKNYENFKANINANFKILKNYIK
eukprot:357474_1